MVKVLHQLRKGKTGQGGTAQGMEFLNGRFVASLACAVVVRLVEGGIVAHFVVEAMCSHTCVAVSVPLVRSLPGLVGESWAGFVVFLGVVGLSFIPMLDVFLPLRVLSSSGLERGCPFGTSADTEWRWRSVGVVRPA